MKVKFLFVLIILLAFILRFWDLGKNPPGVNLDEAAIGWNAYSILKTGRDEYGQYFPLQFRSLDDYKPPLYIYLTVPSVAIFGMNEFAVRLPSALLGVGAVALVYFLALELFQISNFKFQIALAAAGLLAVSPWHLQFTRTAYETGSLAFFTTAGLLFFLKGLKKWPWLILSAIFFGLELYLYQAAKVFVPLFIFVLFILYFKKSLFLFVAIFVLFFLPSFYLSITPEGRLRAWGTSIFQEMRPKKLDYAPTIINNYLLHFSPQFLFGLNLGPKITYVPNVGLMYLWELPLFLAGLYYLFKEKDKKLALIMTAWILLSPLPASVTTGLPSSVRTAIFLPSLQIITALGAINLFRKYKTLIPLFGFLSLSFLIFYLKMLLTSAPVSGSKTWYQGYRQIIEESAKLAPKYNRVLVSNRLDQTLNFYLFFLNYDPKKFLEIDGGRISGGFAENQNHFANFYFKQNINYSLDRKIPKTLFVGTPDDFPGGVRTIKKFSFSNGEPSAYIIAGDYQ